MIELPTTQPVDDAPSADAVETALAVAEQSSRKLEHRSKLEIWPRSEGLERSGDFGAFRPVRKLTPGPLGERVLAVHVRDHSSHVIHRSLHKLERAAQRRFSAAVLPAASLRHAHLLAVQSMAFTPQGYAWIATPFTGNQDGLLTLSDHIRLKGGRLPAFEVQRAMAQLLDAVAYAHERGVVNGPISATQILVDRHGSLSIELYAIATLLHARIDDESASSEVRSIFALGYRMLTGCRPRWTRSGFVLPATSLVPRLDRSWDQWLARGLSGDSDVRGLLASMPLSERAAPSRLRAVRAFIFGGR